MPVYPDRGFAFVHIPKTGGTSLVRALAAERTEYTAYGVWDMLEASPEREAIATAIRRNFGLASFVSFPQQHLPAAALRALLGDAWDSLFSFACVRNPWDMLVSTYAFARAHAPGVSTEDPDRSALMARCDTFARFVELYPLLRADQTAMVSDGDLVLVTEVLRFERLADDVAALRDRLGLTLALGFENASAREADYRTYFTPRTQALAAKHFARDIDRFGYLF